MQKKNVIAILLADIHLSLTSPIWRSAEPDWMATQKRVLDEVKYIQKKYDCPILCAGDIFDWWDSKPELINFAMEHLPNHMHCIPGQHDLPRHRYEDIHRSAYWTLIKAKKISTLSTFVNISHNKINDLEVFGYPFGYKIKILNTQEKKRGKIYIALVHDYIWIPGHSYSNAPEKKKLKRIPFSDAPKISRKRIGKWKGYDVIVYGDNHDGFLTKIGDTTIFNCGTLMRRHSDEIDYKPQIGLLLKTGEVILHYLDTSQDKYLIGKEEEEKDDLDLNNFFKELEKLGDSSLDFKKAILRWILKNKSDKQVKEILIEAMEQKNE